MNEWVEVECPLRSLSCLTSQQNVDLFFDPIFVVRSISIADFLVPKQQIRIKLLPRWSA